MRTTNRVVPAMLALALALSACGDDAATEPAAAADPPEEASEAEAAGEDVVEALDDVAVGSEEPEQLPFDPDAGIDPRQIEYQEWGDDEPRRPFEHMLLPDDFVLPATARLSVLWAEADEPFGGTFHSRTAAHGDFVVYEADPDEVAAFFTDRLPDQGWELEEERRDGGNWSQVWNTLVPFDGWEEDWQADELAVLLRVELVHQPRAHVDEALLTFRWAASAERHRF